ASRRRGPRRLRGPGVPGARATGRRPAAAGDPEPVALPRIGGCGLPEPGPADDHPLRGRGPPHPARRPDRSPDAGHPPRPRRALAARAHNLPDTDADIPPGVVTAATGVSGAGKSTLVDDILQRALGRRLYGAAPEPGRHRALQGAEAIDKVIAIDQSPIGRTPRSNPATYTGAFTFIREMFSLVPEARARGYKPG